MNEISFSQEHTMAEIQNAKSRELTLDRLFVLLLGPSATGKSTIINHMNDSSSSTQFEYVKPMMTRANRPGETDKTSISDEEFCTLDTNGEFVVVNNLYGVRYGTPLRGILSPLTRGNVPILDYPLDTVESLKRPEYDTLKFYIYPPSIVSWRNRVESSERNDSGRLEAGTRELGSLAISGFIHPNIDISIINEDGAANVSAQQIIEVVEEVVG